MPELTQDTWFGVPAPAPEVLRHTGLKASDPNPAITVYGTGPQAARCGTPMGARPMASAVSARCRMAQGPTTTPRGPPAPTISERRSNPHAPAHA